MDTEHAMTLNSSPSDIDGNEALRASLRGPLRERIEAVERWIDRRRKATRWVPALMGVAAVFAGQGMLLLGRFEMSFWWFVAVGMFCWPIGAIAGMELVTPRRPKIAGDVPAADVVAWMRALPAVSQLAKDRLIVLSQQSSIALLEIDSWIENEIRRRSALTLPEDAQLREAASSVRVLAVTGDQRAS